MRVLLALLAFSVGGATPAIAQKRCTKGIPCGNTCISATKICRIGSAPPAEPMPASTDPAPSGRSVVAPATASTDSGTGQAPATEFPWIGSFADGVYFRADCPVALDLAPTNRRYFRMHQDAEAAGYRRSRTPGC